MIIAVFIVVIAWINYINLATARSIERAKEVGIRKTLGSLRRQLIGQTFAEPASTRFGSVGIFASLDSSSSHFS